LLTVLRQRDFALLWSAGVVSRVGDWLLFVALPYHVYELTGSALATGLTLMTYNVARLLFSPLAGAIVDRLDRRTLLVLSNLASALAICPLLLVTTPERVWLASAVVFVQACLAFLHGPADSAFVAQVVPNDRLVPANALNAGTSSAASLLGPTLGGAAVALWGFPAAVLGDALSFLVAAILIALIRPSPAVAHASPPTPRATLLDDWRTALTLITRSHLLRSLFLVETLVMLAYGIVGVLTVVFVRDALGGGPLEFGWFVTAGGTGALLGSIAASRLADRVRVDRLIGLSLLAMGAAYAIAFNAGALPVVLVAAGAAGLAMNVWSIAERTLLQRAVPNDYLGRLFGALSTASGLLILLGAGAASLLAGPLGPVPILTSAAVLYCTAGLLALVILRRAAPGPVSAEPPEPAPAAAPAVSPTAPTWTP
jgi:MFS family permease